MEDAVLWEEIAIGMWFSEALQVLPGTCCCVGCSPWLWLHRGHVHLCRVLHRLQCEYLFFYGFLYVLQGNLCSGIWSTSSRSFSTYLNICRAVSLISVPCLTAAVQYFLGKHVFSKTSSLGSSAVACGESVGASCVQQRSPGLFSCRHLLTTCR